MTKTNKGRAIWLLTLIIACSSVLILLGCESDSAISEQAKRECREFLDGLDCQENCEGEPYTYCYVDPENARGRTDWRKDCHGVAVGEQCEPCRRIFSVNFGGAFRKVTCAEFFDSIERKNRQCDNCLQRIEHPDLNMDDLF